MKANNQTVLADSGFWIALYNPEKEPMNNIKATKLSELIEDAIVCIPWPTMYEFVNSQFAKNRDRLDQFKRVLDRPNAVRISDSVYKSQALDNLFNYHAFGFTDISLVDEVIKLMLNDKRLSVKYFITFDEALRNYATSLGINTSLID